MAEINPYDLMYKNQLTSTPKEKDIIDKHIEFLNSCNYLHEAKDYIMNNFTLSEDGYIQFPELNKEVYIHIDDAKVEFCALKNHKQYFGKGWLPRKKDEL